MDQMLKDRVILVTGATGALGSAAVKACARAGATVVLSSRNIARLEKLYDGIIAAGGPTPAIYPLDLYGASEQDYTELAGTLDSQLGGLHGLVHCAAEIGHLSPLSEVTGARWQRLLQINLTAPFLLTRAVTNLMIGSGGGSVIFIGDSAVGEGKAFWGAYGVAKIGLHGFASIMNNETESFGLNTTVFIPGPMRTPVRLHAYPGESLETLPLPDVHTDQIVRLLGRQSPIKSH